MQGIEQNRLLVWWHLIERLRYQVNVPLVLSRDADRLSLRRGSRSNGLLILGTDAQIHRLRGWIGFLARLPGLLDFKLN